MPVDILLKGNKEVQEYSAALELKNIFFNDLKDHPKAKGHILIYPSATLFGQKTKPEKSLKEILPDFRDSGFDEEFYQ